MSTQEEWRDHQLQQLGFLRGFVFRLSTYKSPSHDWDHDHCNGCWAKFAEFDGPDIQHEGYVTSRLIQRNPSEPPKAVIGARTVEYPVKDGIQLEWVCAKCFEEFKEELEWTVDPNGST